MFCFLLLAAALVQGLEGLYDERDAVVILDHANFHSTISGREHAWLVEFYASWCGYCRNFAPIFKREKQIFTKGTLICAYYNKHYLGLRNTRPFVSLLSL